MTEAEPNNAGFDIIVESIATKLGQPIEQVRADIDIEAKRLHQSKLDVAKRVNSGLVQQKPAGKPAEKKVEKPAATPEKPAPAPEKPLGQMTEEEIDAIMETENTALAETTEPALPADISQAQEMRNKLDAVKKGVLRKGNTNLINNKVWINRSGWRLIAGAFNVSDKILSQSRSVDEKGIITWTFIVEASMPNGRSATGVGMCKSNEKGGKEEHAVFATAHTRAKSRAISDIVGAGEVSAEEIGE